MICAGGRFVAVGFFAPMLLLGSFSLSSAEVVSLDGVSTYHSHKGPFYSTSGKNLNGAASRYSQPNFQAIAVDAKKAARGDMIIPPLQRVSDDQRAGNDVPNQSNLFAEQVEHVLAYLKTLKM